MRHSGVAISSSINPRFDPAARSYVRTPAEADFRRHWGLSVVAIQREGKVVSNPDPDFQLQTGDVVVVFGSSAQIAQFEEKCGGG